MFTLSQTTGYAIKALTYLSDAKDGPVLIQDISVAAGVPAPYLAKIVRRLRSADIVTAKRGYKGGVQLARPAGRITLRDIGEAIEGEELVGECLLGKVFCEDLSECPTYPFWKKTRTAIRQELARITLTDLVALKKSKIDKAKKQRKKRARARPSRRRPARSHG